MTAGKAGAYTYNIHFWLGKDANQDEAGAAAVKAVELDSVLGNRAVEYRELQGHESNRFLSYFKPCLIPPEGGFGSEVKTPEEEEEKEKEEEEEDGEEKEEKEKPEPRLYTCKGKRVVRLKQVPFTRSTLNHDEMFILDTKDKIFMFNGANTNVQERFKALDVVQNMKERYHEGNCNVAIVDKGKLQSEGPSAEFWALFGGFAPIGGKKVSSDDDIIPEKTPPKLYCIVRGQFQEIDGELSKSSLHNDRCYLLYCGTDLFIWFGRTTPLPDKKFVMHAAESLFSKKICQDDLFPEDVLILDTHVEVIVWVGHLAQSTEKQNAFETGEKYVELAASMDSLSPSVILYRVIEGNEPCFFTTYFSWDPAKTTAHGNAFHKKAVQLFGSGCVAEPRC
ncbi:hypothetical protein Lser_V15G09437 [Lactuca serriola]